MRNKIFAIAALMPMIVSTGVGVAQPTVVPETKKENLQKIEEVVEMKLPKTEPTKDEVAKAQIAQRQAEMAKQAEAENLKKLEEQKQIEAAKAQELAKKVATSGVKPNAEQWRSIVAKYPWPVDQAMLTMSRESGGNPRAISATDDHGLFQIHGGYAKYGEKIYDPEFNISLAYNNYYKGRGWTPWYAVRGILW
ncbi:MAG: transglycosylase SLT domain-containing protein [bacterium]|nr:transglycosylase SLT domain-containing protein [bacterium]